MGLSDEFKQKLLQPLEDLFLEALDNSRSPRGGRNYKPVESGPPSLVSPTIPTRRKRKKPRTVDADALRTVKQEMDNLIGLSAVKGSIQRLVNLARVDVERRQRRLPGIRPALHMVFMGNPGTGKTTMARLVGRLLHALGFLSEGHTVETDKADLVGGYLGQTPGIVAARIEEAMGGVLFIDEAYSLAEAREDLYGQEAIGVMLKRMEDCRDDLVVIAAGYPDKMQAFLSANPGVRSRFTRILNFPDYTPVVLQQILVRLCQENGLTTTPGLLLRSEMTWQRLEREGRVAEGNGRLARSAFERMIENQAGRLVTAHGIMNENLNQLIPTDWDGVEEVLQGGRDD